MELDQHFSVDEQGNLYFSEMGIARIATDMKHNSTISESRKAWMDVVGEVVERCFQAEVKHLLSAPKRIEEAVKKAKQAARGRCQVTGSPKKRTTPWSWTAITCLIAAAGQIWRMPPPTSWCRNHNRTANFTPGTTPQAAGRKISWTSSPACAALSLIR